jgi:glucokinase
MSKSEKPRYWVGFDLGGTKMLASVYDERLERLASKRKRTKGHAGEKVGLERMIDAIDRAIEEAKLGRGDLAGIGVGCPGPLDLKRGILHEAPNLGWKDVALKETLEKEFGCPTVIANDVDMGVYGEYRLGAAQSARCVLGVFPGTGIGGGCVYEDNILTGGSISCMEIGHIQVVPDGPLCGCGRAGCLEAVASRLAISAAAAQAAFRGQAPNLLKAAGTDLSNIRSGTLAAAIRAGDREIERIVLRAARYLGDAIASVVNLLAPDTVVLGGGLVEAMPELYLSTVDETARNRTLPSYASSFKVVAATLGDNATSVGAAAWVQHVGS